MAEHRSLVGEADAPDLVSMLGGIGPPLRPHSPGASRCTCGAGLPVAAVRKVYPASPCFTGHQPVLTGVILGFGHLSETAIAQGVAYLAKALQPFRR